jgi:nucleotide-binding universal stress UspA family protein
VFRKILVPLDGSTQAEAALPLVRSLAQNADAEVVLLRVADDQNEAAFEYPSAPVLFGVLSPEAESELLHDADAMRSHALADVRLHTEGYLERVVARWFTSQPNVTTEVCFGPPAEVICNFAEGMKADVIVLSTHGWTPMNYKGIGSVADRVIRHAKVPVLSVRPVFQSGS